VIRETPLDRAWLETIPCDSSPSLVAALAACPGEVPGGGVVPTPVDNLTWSVADGEARIARVSQSNVRTADARLVEQGVRMLLGVVYA
jgi:hypothetical protein